MNDEILLEFKEIKYLLKKQLPDLKVIKKTDKGFVLKLDFLKLQPRKGEWKKKDVTIYTFNNISLPKKVEFAIRHQKIKSKDDFKLFIDRNSLYK